MRVLLFLPVSLVLSGCAGLGLAEDADFPSLAKRAYEDAPAIPEPRAPVVAPVQSLPPALADEVAAAVERNAAADAAFARALPTVRRAVARAAGAARSSETWVVAQMELAALESARAPSVGALADLDRLFLAREASEFGRDGSAAPPGGGALIADRRAPVAATVADQQEVIDVLRATLR